MQQTTLSKDIAKMFSVPKRTFKRRLWLDTETYNETPINVGTYRYAETVEIILWQWAIDDGEAKDFDATVPGAEFPQELLDALRDPECEIAIHNARFDKTVINEAAGIDIPWSRIHDVMVKALCHGLPGALGKLCEIFKIDADDAKNKDGKALINLFCKPRPKKQKLRRATRETHPEEWLRFREYGRSDIRAMRAVDAKIPDWNYRQDGSWQRAIYELDAKINDMGFLCDRDLSRGALRAVAEEQERLKDQIQEETFGAVSSATKRDQMIDYILESYGIQLEDLRKGTVADALEDETLPEGVKVLLRIRQQASASSTSKYKALEKAVSRDDRLRGTIQFRGAKRTGRSAGRIFQPQNLSRPTMSDEEIELGIQAIKDEMETLVVSNVMSLASNSLRGCIIPPKGRKFCVADLSNIEGRAIAWLAGEETKLQAFRDFDAGIGHDIYAITASKMFGNRPEDVIYEKKHGLGIQRQTGKCAELGLGFGGGPGAFNNFALVYNLDLEEIAKNAREAIPGGLLVEAAEALAWAKKKKINRRGMSDDVWMVAEAFKRAWRYAHPMTVAFWKACEDAFRGACQHPGEVFNAGPHIKVKKIGKWVVFRLPSGRNLCYPNGHIDPESGKLKFLDEHPFTKRFCTTDTYGGKLAENMTQAFANDVLAHGQLIAEAQGYEVVLHVHDENICETPDTPDFTHQKLSAIMATPPIWAPDIPLEAAGFESYRYKKD